MNRAAIGHAAVTFGAGGLFALGLGVAGMTRPEKIIAFLDLFGAWDPSLAFVMGGALGLYGLFIQWRRRRLHAPVASPECGPEGTPGSPERPRIDGPLLGGAALFGIGWGLAGFCPGPAIASLASGLQAVLLFVASMAAGMVLHQVASILRRAPYPPSFPARGPLDEGALPDTALSDQTAARSERPIALP